MSPLSLVVVVLAIITPILADNDEIPIERAEQSSDYYPAYTADKALDGDFSSPAVTLKEDNPWLRLYFTSSSNVEKVVIEEGRAYDVPSCTYRVSVYKGEVKTLCGTYTRTRTGGKVEHYNETVQCGGKEGDSVMLEVTGCTVHLSIYEIKVYSQGEAQVTWVPTVSMNSNVPYNTDSVLHLRATDGNAYYGWDTPGDVFFLNKKGIEFMVAFHPERGNIAIKNSKFSQGTSQWGYQWVDVSYAGARADQMLYSIYFTASHVVLICNDDLLMQIPLSELVDDVPEYLSEVYGVKLEYKYTDAVLEYAIIAPEASPALVNVALGGTASQSSLSWSGAASRAIDGNTNGDYMKGGSCTHTSESATAMVAPWWKVAFKSGSNIIVDHVEVFNRKDCCQGRIDGAKVYVAQKSPFGDIMRLCGTIQYVQSVFSYTIPCKSTGGSPLVGHAVKIYGAGGMALTLCEVKVMAQPANDDGDTDNGGTKCVDKVMNCPMLTNYCTMSHIKDNCGLTCSDGTTC